MGKEFESYMNEKKALSRFMLFMVFLAGMLSGAALMFMVSLMGLVG